MTDRVWFWREQQDRGSFVRQDPLGLGDGRLAAWQRVRVGEEYERPRVRQACGNAKGYRNSVRMILSDTEKMLTRARQPSSPARLFFPVGCPHMLA
jgi:hypothetical protein